jgi:DNA-binding XRE family transcriptional regulator
MLDILRLRAYVRGVGREPELIVHLKRHRTERGMTQEGLAERAGVTRQTILSIERGRYSPSIELALRLGRIFGVPVEALFELAEPARPGKERRRD